MGKLRFLEVIIYDSWGILALAFLWAIDTASRNEIFHSEYILSFKILENFKYCLKRIGIDFNYIQKVIFSEYSIILILTVCVVFLSIGFYIIVPELLRASSYCAAVYFGSTLILDSKIDYKTQILLYTFLISTMCVNMLQATPLDHDHNSTMISKIFTRTTPAGFEFWLSLFGFLVVIFVKASIFRFMNFNNTHTWSIVLYLFLLVSELNSIVYLSRSVFGVYFCKKKLPWFNKFDIRQRITLFFTSRCAALCKSIYVILSPFLFVLNRIFRKFNISVFDSYLENNRVKIFYSILCDVTYLEAIKKSKSIMWNGELRSSIMDVHLKTHLFPVMLAFAFIFCKFFRSIFWVFRMQDIIFIVLAHFILAIEIINTFTIVQLISEKFDPKSLDSSEAKVVDFKTYNNEENKY